MENHGKKATNEKQIEPPTAGVKDLLGDPKKAIVKLSIPITVSLVISSAYQLINIFWVSGLGPDSLSAVGFFSPIFIFLMAVVMGIRVGGQGCISQRLGARDKAEADNYAEHTLVFALLISLLLTIPLLYFTESMFSFLGAQKVVDLGRPYARIMIAGFPLMLFNQTSGAILISEGNAKRTMVASIIGIVINMVLDPIFIYLLNLGVAGAAWASLFSRATLSLVFINWLFFKRITYVTIRFTNFTLKRKVLLDIMKLGFPLFMSGMFLALVIFINTKIVSIVAGTIGVAIYAAGVQFINIVILPARGIAAGGVSVAGATFGAQSLEKLDLSYKFALKFGLVIEGVLALATFMLAPLLTLMFTWSEGSKGLIEEFMMFFHIIALIFPAIVISETSSSYFAGVGKGVNSLTIVAFNVIFSSPFAFILGVLLNYRLAGIWVGIITANWAAALIGFVWWMRFVRRVKGVQKTHASI